MQPPLQSPAKIPHVKRSVTLRKDYDEVLQNSDRKKSTIINEALELYFSRQEALEKAEYEWMQEYLRPALEDPVSYAINPNGEKITKELLEKNLWSRVDALTDD